jgi:hypothetical protein
MDRYITEKVTARLELLVEVLVDIAMVEVERLVKEELEFGVNGFQEFTMAMGSVSFEGESTGCVLIGDDSFPDELECFIRAWDDTLKLTGNPIRIDRTLKVERDW